MQQEHKSPTLDQVTRELEKMILLYQNPQVSVEDFPQFCELYTEALEDTDSHNFEQLMAEVRKQNAFFPKPVDILKVYYAKFDPFRGV